MEKSPWVPCCDSVVDRAMCAMNSIFSLLGSAISAAAIESLFLSVACSFA
jgi:hypothetical protein